MATTTMSVTTGRGRSGSGGPARVLPLRGSGDVEALLRRSDAHVIAADLATDPAERFVHGHLAALRAGAALLAGSPPVRRRRGRPRPVWELVTEAAPELASAAAMFAQGASVRAAFEAGRAPEVAPEQADRTVAAAEDFQDAVRRFLDDRGVEVGQAS